MPKTFFKYLFFALIVLTAVNAKWKDESNPGIVWNEMNHEFGDIIQGEIVETNFTLTNTTNDTLEIENVQGSCGCIVTKWSNKPVLPNTSSNILVKFDPQNKIGKQYKSLTVYTSMGAYYLKLNANVVKRAN
ncbi:MAG: DUF1573 domain-containing protein [bacterium]|nr:DUF1573 domain-containing protein [bacterium]